MNGMILQTPTESKDIKLSDKKGANTKSEKGDNLFENLIAQLVDKESESENSNFLLGKLLNLSSDFTNKGKTISDFSKGDIITDEKGEEILLEDLFKIALSFKNDQPIEELDNLPKELKITLKEKDVIAEFKEAKNIKELLNVANKHDIKVKNFQFFISENALDSKDQKMVQKLTSEDIFKMADPKQTTKEPQITQNILSKIINHDKEKKGSEKTTLTSLLSKEREKEKENTKLDKLPINEVKNEQKKIISPKIETTTASSEESSLELDGENFQLKKPQKSSQNRLSTLLNNETTTSTDIKKSQTTPLKEEVLIKNESETKESVTEKNTHITDIKSETVHKTKETPEMKKTFNTFAMEFKEKVEAYKPPMMKINMQLSPKNLGDVDVTLITRGNNLHVNINANSNNTLALFVQNQAEFKNSLVNMGFSDLQMNFGDGREQQRGQNHKKDEQQSDYHDSLENEEIKGIEIIIPNYV